MSTNRALTMTGLLAAVSAVCATALPVASADSGVAPVIDYGGGCVVDPGDRAVTVNSLRSRCSLEQQNTIFSAASLGAVPDGVTSGWVTTPAYLQAVAPAIWTGKTFYTGPDGGYVMNRVTGAGIESFPADVYSGPAIRDGAPTWVLNYAPSPIPWVYDEIRQITPGVWFGYSWRRDTAPPTLMLTFALAD
ncbi:hypothetical protein ACTD5D_00820 [Nocardia takedensis]|uniref:hypothetical protein n=1 Tax=Nocardia takedensis TaxID=259390 RepID=UPI0005936E15|nr:hypothetical protein [Nocardia takedensis]